MYWYYDKEYKAWRKLKNRLGYLLRKKLGFLVAQGKCHV